MFRALRSHTFHSMLIGLVVLAFLLRMYKITNPLADWHSFRQADTASVTREYVKHGVDFLRPRYHDLSNIQSGENHEGRDNVQGWRMVEFPLINGILAYILRAFPQLDLVLVSRLASVLASLCTLLLLIRVTARICGEKIALVSGFFFSVLPYSVYYSRAVLPEPFFIALSLGSVWAYQEYLHKGGVVRLVGSVGLFALALLVKPMAVFFVPVFFAVRFSKSFDVKASDVVTGALFALSFIPLLLWRRWIQQYAIGIPISAWLYNGVGKGTNLLPIYQIRFKPAWFRWIFYERLTKLFLGYVGLIPFVLGFVGSIVNWKKEEYGKALYLGMWTLGALLYVSVFAAGNVQHDYYQVPLVPFVSLALGYGTVFIYEQVRRVSSSVIGIVVCALLSLLLLFFSWKRVAGYYQINHWDIVAAGREADRMLPQDAKVIAPYTGDTAFLFQTNRTGWPIGFDIDTKISEGAGYYVSVNYDDETHALMKKYTVVVEKKEYVIIDLTKPVVPVKK